MGLHQHDRKDRGLNQFYAIGQQHVYYVEGGLMRGYEPSGAGQYIAPTVTLLSAADPATFHVFKRFAVDKFHAWLSGVVIQGADAKSFKEIGGDGYSTDYASDKNNLYTDSGGDRRNFGVYSFDGGIDPATFHFLSTYFSGSIIYAADKNHVYIPIQPSDSRTLSSLSTFMKNRTSVSRLFQILSGADVHTFKTIDLEHVHEYALDSQHVFYDGSRIEGADPATFKVLDEEYGFVARDATHIFYIGKAIEGVDAATFRGLSIGDGGLINFAYSKDKNAVYCLNSGTVEKLDADPMTFHVLSDAEENSVIESNGDPYDAVDKSGKFRDCKRM